MDSTTDSSISLMDNTLLPSDKMSHLTSPVIRVIVGLEPNAKEFFLHDKWLCGRSLFFQHAMNGSWQESEERKVTLSEDEPSVFQSCLEIVYTRSTKNLVANRRRQNQNRRRYLTSSCAIYMRLLYLLKDYRSAEEYPPLEAVQLIYNKTAHSRDDMRIFLAMFYTDGGKAELFVDNSEDDSRTAEIPVDVWGVGRKAPGASEEAPRSLHSIFGELSLDCDEKQMKLDDMADAYNTMQADRDKVRDQLTARIEQKDRIIEETTLDLERARQSPPSVKVFFVHEDLICMRSEFFKKALDGRWKESEEAGVHMPEDDPSTFSMYIKLLYTDALVHMEEADCSSADSTPRWHLRLNKLYVLAEKILDDTTKNMALTAMDTRANKSQERPSTRCPDVHSIKVIYEGTPEKSPARSEFLKDFLYDLSISLLEKRPLPEEHQRVLTDKQHLFEDYNRAKRAHEAAEKRTLTVEKELEAARTQLARRTPEPSYGYAFGE
ncbi:hypothetical protein E8E11_005861 [Didymella keratinophila]|nr:hypothetical protein E8E11_005861 [Didymella keratinophila]